VNAYLASFEQLFPGSTSLYNGKAFFVWSSGDPHILGAYSYLAVGQYTEFNGIQGRQEGRLRFAGEQTSLNFQGYIEGALRSGYRCADEVARVRAPRVAGSIGEGWTKWPKGSVKTAKLQWAGGSAPPAVPRRGQALTLVAPDGAEATGLTALAD